VSSLALVGALVAGCAQTQLRVVQKVPGERPRANIYVVVYEGGVEASFAHELSRALTEALGAHTSARKATVLTGLEFDMRFLDRDMDASGADAVLTLKPLGAATGRHGQAVDVIFGVTFEDRASGQPLWAARLEVDGALWLGIEPAAQKIVDALASDHLIAPAAVSR
jgi:hypothetical protein